MKRFVLMVFSAMLLMPMFAQEQASEKKDAKACAEKKAAMLRDSLGLDDAQYEKVVDLFYNDIKAREVAKEDAQLAEENLAKDRENKEVDRRVEREKALQSILTDEQYKKYSLMKVAHRKPHRAHPDSCSRGNGDMKHAPHAKDIEHKGKREK